ncbi:MAG: flagellar basal body protein [Alphaproteobacteria bacterium]
MDFSNLGLFRLISQRMDWLNQRQSVLAENIANSDTPDYRPNDLAPFKTHLAGAGGASLAPTTTHAAHLGPAAGQGGAAATEPQGDVYEVSPTGNEVVLEQQMLRVAETAMQHQLAINLYRKHVGMIRTALGRGRG